LGNFFSRDTSDHTPCLISAATYVPKPHIFKFENYWLEYDQFTNILLHGWNIPTLQNDKAKVISAKYKNLKRVLKAWRNQLHNLAKTIQNCKDVIMFLDILEEHIDLNLGGMELQRHYFLTSPFLAQAAKDLLEIEGLYQMG
jgi:hypothetical protein